MPCFAGHGGRDLDDVIADEAARMPDPGLRPADFASADELFHGDPAPEADDDGVQRQDPQLGDDVPPYQQQLPHNNSFGDHRHHHHHHHPPPGPGNRASHGGGEANFAPKQSTE